MPGAVPTSTGPLGDEAHAISVVRTTSGGLQAVEITVVWRVGNLVNIIVARGRYGGTRLDDALVLAGLQTQNELPAPRSAASAGSALARFPAETQHGEHHSANAPRGHDQQVGAVEAARGLVRRDRTP